MKKILVLYDILHNGKTGRYYNNIDCILKQNHRIPIFKLRIFNGDIYFNKKIINLENYDIVIFNYNEDKTFLLEKDPKYNMLKKVSAPLAGEVIEKLTKDMPSEKSKDAAKSSPDTSGNQKPAPIDTITAFASVIDTLYKNEKIYHVDSDEEFYQMDIFEREPEIDESDSDVMTVRGNRIRKKSTWESIFDAQSVYYCTFGDFVSAYMKKMLDDLDLIKKLAISDAKSEKITTSTRDIIVRAVVEAEIDIKRYHILIINFFK
mgnify:CR=1 FL=1